MNTLIIIIIWVMILYVTPMGVCLLFHWLFQDELSSRKASLFHEYCERIKLSGKRCKKFAFIPLMNYFIAVGVGLALTVFAFYWLFMMLLWGGILLGIIFSALFRILFRMKEDGSYSG